MTTGLVVNVTGKMFMGAITAIDGTGGEEIVAVAGRKFLLDTGWVVEPTKDQIHHDIIKKMNGPGILDVDMHDVASTVQKEILRPLWDSTGVNPSGAATPEIYGKIPSTGILILPTTTLDGEGTPNKAIYFKAAKLWVDSQTVVNYSLDLNQLPDATQFVATSYEGDDGLPPFMWDIPSAIATVYGL